MPIKDFDKKITSFYPKNKEKKTIDYYVLAKQIILGGMVVVLIGYWAIPEILTISDDATYALNENSGIEGDIDFNTEDVSLDTSNEFTTTEANIEILMTATDIENLNESIATSLSDYFANYKMERDRVRAEQLEILNGVINSYADAESIATASAKILEINEALEGELMIENLLVARGIENVAAFIDEGRINLVIGEDGARTTEDEIAKLAQLTSDTCGITLENIFITLKSVN